MKKWRCLVCGEVFEGDAPPDSCPVCAAPTDMFEEVEVADEVALEEAVAAMAHSDPKPATAPGNQWRCVVCGQVFDGEEPPVPCPVCGAELDAFERLEAQTPLSGGDTDRRYVLVGGGVAAVEAAKAIRRRDKSGRITIIGSENHRPYHRPRLSDVVCDGTACEALELEAEGFYEEMKIDLKMGAQVGAIDTGARKVRLENGEEVAYDRLLLATGAYAFDPIERGADSIPVKTLRSYEDARALGALGPNSLVVLVGGGILGLEAALSLHKLGCAVTVVEFAPRILPLQADEKASALLQKALEAMGIMVITGQSVQRATGTGVVLSSGETRDAELVLESMGVRSNVALAVPIGLELGRGIVVDEHMHTSHPDIWAAGDCAEYEGRVQALVGAASAMGAVAGASMAGDEGKAYEPFTPATMLAFTGFSLFSVGAVGQAGTEGMTYENADTGAYQRLFFEEGRLTGALFIGAHSAGAKATKAVAAGAPLAKAKELLG